MFSGLPLKNNEVILTIHSSLLSVGSDKFLNMGEDEDEFNEMHIRQRKIFKSETTLTSSTPALLLTVVSVTDGLNGPTQRTVSVFVLNNCFFQKILETLIICAN